MQRDYLADVTLHESDRATYLKLGSKSLCALPVPRIHPTISTNTTCHTNYYRKSCNTPINIRKIYIDSPPYVFNISYTSLLPFVVLVRGSE